MAELLNNQEIRQILGTVIKDGVASSVRPNSYVLRLGGVGEFLTTGKEFALGPNSQDKKGIKVPPGHSVALTAFELIDFTRETVEEHFPDCDLHALISPTTDLQREGVVAPTTQIDAGYQGTLNWTLSNSSSEERRFLYKERLFRLAIFKLARGERPDALYEGAYQGKTGYVRSERSGAPVGIRATDWVDPTTKESPDALLDQVIRSGFPWNALGTRLKAIDEQFKSVSNEYADIHESMGRLKADLDGIRKNMEGINAAQDGMTDRIRRVVREELPAMQDRWLVLAGSGLLALVGIGISVFTSEFVLQLLAQHGAWLGPVLTVVMAGVFFWRLRRGKSEESDE